MTHLTKLLLFFLFITFITSCGQRAKNEMATSSYDNNALAENEEEITDGTVYKDAKKTSPTKVSTSTPGVTGGVVKIPKKIIKTANRSFGAKEYKVTRAKIGKLITEYKGYISKENEQNTSYNISNTLMIRVEQKNFDALLDALTGTADKLESKSVNAVDVTAEFVDIIKRLENKRKYEAQYLELLKKAKSIDEILRVNEYIRALREEIEAKEGRLKYLQNQVGLSTITLYLHQDYNTVTFGFFHKLSKALENGWSGLLVFILGVVTIWPFWIIVIAIIFIVKRIIKKARAKKRKKG